jgi:1-deoxy-D-xylulose-5-phosphate synthase
MPNWKTPFKEIPAGKGQKIKEGEDVVILSIGHIGNYAIEVCRELEKEGINIGHYDMRFAKPLDEELLHEAFTQYKKIITLEDGCLMGGFGSAILEFAADQEYFVPIKRIGIPDRIVEHGTQGELHAECGMDPESLKVEVERCVGEVVKG